MLAVLRQDSFGYQLVYFFHIASVIVAFSAAFVHPRFGGLARQLPGSAGSSVNQAIVKGSVTLHFPALVLTGLFGSALVAMSDDAYSFSDLWISLAYLVWFAMLAILFFLMLPAERALARDPGDADAGKKVGMFGGILHLLLAVMLVIMVWKPGL